MALSQAELMAMDAIRQMPQHLKRIADALENLEALLAEFLGDEEDSS